MDRWHLQPICLRLTEADRQRVLDLVTELLLSLASRRSKLRPVQDDLAACLKESLFRSFLHEALPVYHEVRALMSLDGGDVPGFIVSVLRAMLARGSQFKNGAEFKV